MRRAVLLACLVLAPSRLPAQTVVSPQAPLDSTRAALRDALLVLRDSLSSIDAAAGRLQRDNRQASGPALVSPARVMTEACARSARTVPSTRLALTSASASTEVRARRQRELLLAMNRLRDALARCQADFEGMSKPGQGEQVRGYGNDRAAQVQAAIRKYESAANRFLASMGIKVHPRGVEPSPSAG